MASASRRIRQQDAVRAIGPPSHPAAELMELREPEALGVLDEHHARVRHVDADLDDGRGDEHVHLPRREGGHRRVPLVGPLLAVDDADAQLRQRGPQPFGLGLHARHGERLRLGHERDDDERLASLGRLAGEEGLDLRQRRSGRGSRSGSADGPAAARGSC